MDERENVHTCGCEDVDTVWYLYAEWMCKQCIAMTHTRGWFA